MKCNVEAKSWPPLTTLLLSLALLSCRRDQTMVSQYQAWKFHYRSDNCQARLLKGPSGERLNSYRQGLKERGWNLIWAQKDGRIFANELYFSFEEKKFVSGQAPLYKSCKIAIQLKLSQGNLPQTSDKVLYSGHGLRHFPRLTRAGEERCRKALKEALLHIPWCLTPASWASLKKKFGEN